VSLYLHTSQTLSLLPVSSSVAAFVVIQIPKECPFASIFSVTSFLHTSQTPVLLPSSVQVAVFVTVHLYSCFALSIFSLHPVHSF